MENVMRKTVLTLAAALTVLLAAAACGSGMPDPNNTMGPGGMGDDMRIATVDSATTPR
jgi:hypothetical protein